MSNNSNNENLFIFIALIVFGLITFAIWKFSTLINVNFETGLSIITRAGVVLAIYIVFLKIDIFAVDQLTPLLIGALVWSFFPALDYWSAQAVGGVEFSSLFNEQMWYARWYSKAVFVLLPLLGWYGIKYANSR